MLRCPNNYGGNDEFANYNDCHVWTPFILAANLLNLFMAIFNIIYGVKRLAIAPSSLSKYTCLGSALLIFYYVGRIATGYVLGDKVLLINLAHALGYGCLWIVCIHFGLQYLKSYLDHQKIKDKTTLIKPKAEKTFKFFMFFSFVTEVLVLILPCVTDIFVVFPTYYIFNILRVIILMSIFTYFALIVRDLFNASDNQKYAARVRRKLNHVLYPGLGGTIFALIFNILAITVPGMKNNQYAMTPMLYATTMQIFAFVILVLSKKRAYRDTALLDEHQAGQRNSSSLTRSDSKQIDRKGAYTKAPTHGRLDLATTTPYRSHQHHHPNIIQTQSQHHHNSSNSNLIHSVSHKDSSEVSRRLTVPDEPSIVTSEVSRGDDSVPEESKMEISKSGYGTPLGHNTSSNKTPAANSPTSHSTQKIVLPSPPEPDEDSLQRGGGSGERSPAHEKDIHDVWVQ